MRPTIDVPVGCVALRYNKNDSSDQDGWMIVPTYLLSSMLITSPRRLGDVVAALLPFNKGITSLEQALHTSVYFLVSRGPMSVYTERRVQLSEELQSAMQQAQRIRECE